MSEKTFKVGGIPLSTVVYFRAKFNYLAIITGWIRLKYQERSERLLLT